MSTKARYVLGNEARRIYGENYHAVMKAALCGKIRYQVEPGEGVRYSREDLERLAAEKGRAAAMACAAS